LQINRCNYSNNNNHNNDAMRNNNNDMLLVFLNVLVGSKQQVTQHSIKQLNLYIRFLSTHRHSYFPAFSSRRGGAKFQWLSYQVFTDNYDGYVGSSMSANH
jgi:hypothetical protein